MTKTQRQDARSAKGQMLSIATLVPRSGEPLEVGFERERQAARERVEASDRLKPMLNWLPDVRKLVRDSNAEAAKIKKNPDLTPEAKGRLLAENAVRLYEAVAERTEGFNSADQAFRDGFKAVPDLHKMTPADAARIAAIGSVARDLLPETFMDVVEDMVRTRDRAALALFVPMSETFMETRKHYKEHYERMGRLLALGREAMENESTRQAAYAQEVSSELRQNVQFIVGQIGEHGTLDPILFEPDLSAGGTTVDAFTSRLGTPED